VPPQMLLICWVYGDNVDRPNIGKLIRFQHSICRSWSKFPSESTSPLLSNVATARNSQYPACSRPTTFLWTLTISLELYTTHLDVWILFVDRVFQPREVRPVKVKQVQCTGTYCINISDDCEIFGYPICVDVQ